MYKLICRSINKSEKSLTKFTDIYKKVSKNHYSYRTASKVYDGEERDKPNGRLSKRRSGTSFSGKAKITFKTLLFPKRSGGQIGRLSAKSFYSTGQKSKDGAPKKVFKDKFSFALYKNAMEQCERIRKHSPSPGNSANWNVKTVIPQFIEEEKNSAKKTPKPLRPEEETARPIQPKILTEKYIIQKKMKRGFPATTIKVGNKTKVVYPTKKLQYTLNQQSKTVKDMKHETAERYKRAPNKDRYTVNRYNHTVEFVPKKVGTTEEELNNAAFYKKYFGKKGNSGDTGSQASRSGSTGGKSRKFATDDDRGHLAGSFTDPNFGPPTLHRQKEHPPIYGEHGHTGHSRISLDIPGSSSQAPVDHELMLIQKHPKVRKATKYGKMDINKKYNILLKMHQNKKKLAYHVVKPKEQKEIANEEEIQPELDPEKLSNAVEDPAEKESDPIVSHPADTEPEPRFDMDPLKYRRTVIVDKDNIYDIDDICLKSNDKSAHIITSNRTNDTKQWQNVVLKEQPKMNEMPNEQEPQKRAVTPEKIKELIDNQRLIRKHDIAAQNLKEYLTKLQNLREQTSVDRAVRFPGKANNLVQEADIEKLEKEEPKQLHKKVVKIVHPGDLFRKKLSGTGQGNKLSPKSEDAVSITSKASVGTCLEGGQASRNQEDETDAQILQSISSKVSENISKKFKLAEQRRKDEISQFGKLMEHSNRELKRIRVKSAKSHGRPHGSKATKVYKRPKNLLEDYQPKKEVKQESKKATVMKKLLDVYTVRADTKKSAERSEMVSNLKIKEMLSRKDMQEKKKKVFMTDMELVPTKIGDSKRLGQRAKVEVTTQQENDASAKTDKKSYLLTDLVASQNVDKREKITEQPFIDTTEDAKTYNVPKKSYQLSDYSKSHDKKDDAVNSTAEGSQMRRHDSARKSNLLSDTVSEHIDKRDQSRLKSKSFIAAQNKPDMLAFQSLTALKEKVKATEKHLIVKAETSTQRQTQKNNLRDNADCKNQASPDRSQFPEETGDTGRQYRYLLKEQPLDKPENTEMTRAARESHIEQQASTASRSSKMTPKMSQEKSFLLENYLPKSKDFSESNQTDDTLTKTVILEHPTFKCLLDNTSFQMATKGEIGALTSEEGSRNVRSNKLDVSYPKVTNEMNTSNKEYTCLLSAENHAVDQTIIKEKEPLKSTPATTSTVEEDEHEIENQHRRITDRRNKYVPHMTNDKIIGLDRKSASGSVDEPLQVDDGQSRFKGCSSQKVSGTDSSEPNEDLIDQNVQTFYKKRLAESAEIEDYEHKEKEAYTEEQNTTIIQRKEDRSKHLLEDARLQPKEPQKEAKSNRQTSANFSMNIRHPQIPREPPPPPPKNDSNKKDKPKGKRDLILPPPKGRPPNTKLLELMKDRQQHGEEKKELKKKLVKVKIKSLKFKYVIPRKISPTDNKTKMQGSGKGKTDYEMFINKMEEGKREVDINGAVEGSFLCRNAIERNIADIQNTKQMRTRTIARKEEPLVKSANLSHLKRGRHISIEMKNENNAKQNIEEENLTEQVGDMDNKSAGKVDRSGVFFCRNVIEHDVAAIQNAQQMRTKLFGRKGKPLAKSHTEPELNESSSREMKSSYTVEDDKLFRCSSDVYKNTEIIKKNEEMRRRIFGKRQIFKEEQDQMEEEEAAINIKPSKQVEVESSKVFEKDLDTIEDKPVPNVDHLRNEIEDTSLKRDEEVAEKLKEIGQKNLGKKEEQAKLPEGNVIRKLPDIDYNKGGESIRKKQIKSPTKGSRTSVRKDKPAVTVPLLQDLEEETNRIKNIEGANTTTGNETPPSSNYTENNIETIKKNEELRRRILGRRKVFKEEQDQLEEEPEIGVALPETARNKPAKRFQKEIDNLRHEIQDRNIKRKYVEGDTPKQLPEIDYDKNKSVREKTDHTKKEMKSHTMKSNILSEKDKYFTEAQIPELEQESDINKNMKCSYTVDDDKMFMSSSHRGGNIDTIKKNEELRRRILGKRKVFKEEHDQLEDPAIDIKQSKDVKDEPAKDLDIPNNTTKINIENLRNEIDDINQNRKNVEAVEKFEKLRQKIIGEREDLSKPLEVDASKEIPKKSGRTIEEKSDAKKEVKPITSRKFQLLTDKNLKESKHSELAKSWSFREVKLVNEENLKHEIAYRQFLREINNKSRKMEDMLRGTTLDISKRHGKEINEIYVAKKIGEAADTDGARNLVGKIDKIDTKKIPRRIVRKEEPNAKLRSNSAPLQKRSEDKSPEMNSKKYKYILDDAPGKWNKREDKSVAKEKNKQESSPLLMDRKVTSKSQNKKRGSLSKEDTKTEVLQTQFAKSIINVEKTTLKIDEKQINHLTPNRSHTAPPQFRSTSQTKPFISKNLNKELKVTKISSINSSLETTKQAEKLAPADSKYISERIQRKGRRSNSLQSQPVKDDDARSPSPVPRTKSEASYYTQYKQRQRVQSASPTPKSSKKPTDTSSEKKKERSHELKKYENILEERECDDPFSSVGKSGKGAEKQESPDAKKASGGSGKGSSQRFSKKKPNLVVKLILPKVEVKKDTPVKTDSAPSASPIGGKEQDACKLKKVDGISAPTKAFSAASVPQDNPLATSVIKTTKKSYRLDDFVCADCFVKAKEDAESPKELKDPQADLKHILEDPCSKLLSSKYLLKPKKSYAKSCRLDEFEDRMSNLLVPQLEETGKKIQVQKSETKKTETKIQQAKSADTDRQEITKMDSQEFKGTFVDQKQLEQQSKALLTVTATLPKPKPQEDDSKQKQAPAKLKPGKPKKKCIITLSRSPYMPIINVEKPKITYRLVRRRTGKKRLRSTRGRTHKPKKELSNSVIASKSKKGGMPCKHLGVNGIKYHEIYLRIIMERYRIDEVRLKEDESSVPRIDIKFLKRKIMKEKMRRALEKKLRRCFEWPTSGNQATKSKTDNEFDKTNLKDLHNDIKRNREARLDKNVPGTSKSHGDKNIESGVVTSEVTIEKSRKDSKALKVAHTDMKGNLNPRPNVNVSGIFKTHKESYKDAFIKTDKPSGNEIKNNVKKSVKRKDSTSRRQQSQNNPITTEKPKETRRFKYLLESQIKTNPAQWYGFRLKVPPTKETPTVWYEPKYNKSTSKYLLEAQVDSHVRKDRPKPKESNSEKRTYLTNVQHSKHTSGRFGNLSADVIKLDISSLKNLTPVRSDDFVRNTVSLKLKVTSNKGQTLQNNDLQRNDLNAPKESKESQFTNSWLHASEKALAPLELKTNKHSTEILSSSKRPLRDALQYKYLLQNESSSHENSNVDNEHALELEPSRNNFRERASSSRHLLQEPSRYKHLLQNQANPHENSNTVEQASLRLRDQLQYKYLPENQKSLSKNTSEEVSFEFGASSRILEDNHLASKYLLPEKRQYKYLLQDQPSFQENSNTYKQDSLELGTGDIIGDIVSSSKYLLQEKQQYKYLLQNQASLLEIANTSKQDPLEIETNKFVPSSPWYLLQEKDHYRYLLENQSHLQENSNTDKQTTEELESINIIEDVTSSSRHLLKKEHQYKYLLGNQANLQENSNTDKQTVEELEAINIVEDITSSSRYLLQEEQQYKYLLQDQSNVHENSYTAKQDSLELEANNIIEDILSSSRYLLQDKDDYKYLLHDQSNFHKNSNANKQASLESEANTILVANPLSSDYLPQAKDQYKYLLENQAGMHQNSNTDRKVSLQLREKHFVKPHSTQPMDKALSVFVSNSSKSMKISKSKVFLEKQMFSKLKDISGDTNNISAESISKQVRGSPEKVKSLLKRKADSSEGSNDKESSSTDRNILEKHSLSPRHDNLETSKYLLSQVDSDETINCKLVDVAQIDGNLNNTHPDVKENRSDKDETYSENALKSQSDLEFYANPKLNKYIQGTNIEADCSKTDMKNSKSADKPTSYQILDLETMKNSSSHFVKQNTVMKIRSETFPDNDKKGIQTKEIDTKKHQHLLESKRNIPNKRSLSQTSQNITLNTSLRNECSFNNERIAVKEVQNYEYPLERSEISIQDSKVSTSVEYNNVEKKKSLGFIWNRKSGNTEYRRKEMETQYMLGRSSKNPIKYEASEHADERSPSIKAGSFCDKDTMDQATKSEAMIPNYCFLKQDNFEKKGLSAELVKLFEKDKSRYLLDNQLLSSTMHKRSYVTHTSDTNVDKIKKSPVDPKKEKKNKDKNNIKMIPTGVLEDDLQKYILDKNMSTMFVDQPSTSEPGVKAKVEKIYEKEETLKKFNKKLFEQVSTDQTKKNNLSILDLGKVSAEVVESKSHETMSRVKQPPKKINSDVSITKQKTETTKARNIVIEKGLPIFKERTKIQSTTKQLSAFDAKLRVPPKSISKSLISQSVETTTLNLESDEKVMCVQKEDPPKPSVLDKYKHLKITYVTVNRTSSKKNEEGLSTVVACKEEETMAQRPLAEVIAQRYELLKKLHEEFNELNGKKDSNFDRVSKKFNDTVKKEHLTVGDLAKTDEVLKKKICKVNDAEEYESFKEKQIDDSRMERKRTSNMLDIVKQNNPKKAERSHKKKTVDGSKTNMLHVEKKTNLKISQRDKKDKDMPIFSKGKSREGEEDKKNVTSGTTNRNFENQINAKIEKRDKKKIELEKEICEANIKVQPDDHPANITEILIKRIAEADMLKEDEKPNRGQKK